MEPNYTSHHYTEALQRLCLIAQVPVADHATIIENQTMQLGGIPLTFRWEEWSGFIKIYANVGVPNPAVANQIYLYLLEQQLTMPAPFSTVAGIDPQSGSVILYTCANLPTDPESDYEFFALLNACVYAAELIKLKLSQ